MKSKEWLTQGVRQGYTITQAVQDTPSSWTVAYRAAPRLAAVLDQWMLGRDRLFSCSECYLETIYPCRIRRVVSYYRLVCLAAWFGCIAYNNVINTILTGTCLAFGLLFLARLE